MRLTGKSTCVNKPGIFWVVTMATLIAATPVQCWAHPHVWIEARAEVRYAGGKPVSVRNTWTFDPAYSAFLVMGTPKGGDGTIDAKALETAGQKAVGSIEEYGYFTEVRGEAGRMANGTPSGVAMSYDGSRATLAFDLPVTDRREPAGDQPKGKARVEVMDPSYFVSFTFAPGDAVSLDGASPGCSVDVHRPKGFSAEDAKTLAAGVLAALSSGDAAERIGNAAVVSCPVP